MGMKYVSIILAITVLLGLMAPLAEADVTLENFRQPVVIHPHVSVSSDIAEPSLATRQQLSFSFNETVSLSKDASKEGPVAIIPAGTTVYGELIEIRSAKRLGRPGHFLVDFTHVTPPGCEPPLCEPLALTLNPLKMGQGSSTTTHSLFGRQAVVGVLSNAVTIPITLATGIPKWTIVATGNAIEVATGATQEMMIKDPADQRSMSRRAAIGAFRGLTSLPTLWQLSKTAPNVSYQADAPVSVQLPKALWKALFEANLINQQVNAIIEPTASSDPATSDPVLSEATMP